MFYYFDKETRRCAHMSTGPLFADQCQEIQDPTEYHNMDALRYEEIDGECVIYVDEEALKESKLAEAKRELEPLINYNITRLADIVEFGNGEELERATKQSKLWREFRYKVEQATELPLPKPPKEDTDE